MSHPGTPTPDDIERGHAVLVQALRGRPITAEQRTALVAILEILKAAQGVLQAATRRAVGGGGLPDRCGRPGVRPGRPCA